MDLAYVACGRLDGYFERRLKPWDFSAGILLVEEAGGKVSGYQGESIDFTKWADIVVSNGKIHEALIQETFR
ncbi:MAG: inositol monophosphatase family protein [Lachnospiraceae bacterium]|nr:inositol monophosphatase family protein [Lachnospiraceae bacterium]